MSLVNLFSMTEKGRDAVQSQVGQGYSQFGPVAKCLCSHQDDLCKICTSDGSVKGAGADLTQLGICLTTENAKLPTTTAPPLSNNSQMCQRGISLDLTNAAFIELVSNFCKSTPSCQWAPPYTSLLCSSTGFFSPTDGQGLVTGAEKKQVLKKICDETDPLWWSQRKQILPQSLDCSQKKASFARSLFFPGQ